MSAHLTFKFPVPKSSDEYEKLATAIASRSDRLRYQRHGRAGQTQHGVDAYAVPEAGGIYGLQHKKTERFTASMLRKAIDEAETFEPRLARFVIMTTAPRDAKLQRDLRIIQVERRDAGQFPVDMLFWDDLCEALESHQDIAEKFYPTLFQRDGKVRLGGARVASWIQYVLNPWIECLDANLYALAKGDLSWRFYGEPGDVRALQTAVVSSRAAEDFLRANASMQLLVEKHDRLVSSAFSAAAVAHAELANSSDFRSVVFSQLEHYSRGPNQPPYPGGAFREEQLPALFAQHIVNGVRARDPEHSDRDFWTRFGPELQAMTQPFLIAEVRKAVRRLATNGAELRERMAGLHFELCDRFGVAPERCA